MVAAHPTNEIQLSTGEYLLVDFARPGAPPETIGVILRDPEADRVWVRFRRDWDAVDPDEADVLAELEEDIDRAARQMGSGEFFAWLETALSNDLRTSDRETIAMHRPEKTLGDLYRRHVAATVQPFRTHAPVYTLWAAATKFSDQESVERKDDWVEIRSGRKLDPDMFVARVEGRSMEPRIPSGSLCLFRGNVAGSRQGRLVLVEDRSARGGETERYTIKEYHSEKSNDPDRLQRRILLKPLNPEFEAWELDEDSSYAVVGEFLEVLE